MLSSFNNLYMPAEDGSVPIYDLNFSFVETVKFDSNQAVLNWIRKNNLDNKLSGNIPLSSMILFSSEENEKIDSILTKPLFEYITETTQLGENEKLKVIQDLIANFNIFAPERVLSPIGQITKLDLNVIK